MDFFRNHIPYPYSILFTYMVFALYWLSKSPGDHTPGAVDGFFANVGLYKRLEPLRTSASTGMVEPNLQTPRGPLASSLNLTDLGWCVLGREMLGETLFTLKPTRVENSVRKNADPEVSTPIVLLRCGVPRALGRCQDHLGLYMASTLGGGGGDRAQEAWKTARITLFCKNLPTSCFLVCNSSQIHKEDNFQIAQFKVYSGLPTNHGRSSCPAKSTAHVVHQSDRALSY